MIYPYHKLCPARNALRHLIFLLVVWPAWGLEAALEGQAVRLRWPGGRAEIYRSTSPLTPALLNQNLPIASAAGVGEWRDRELAHGVDYYYLVHSQGKWSAAGPLRLPARALPAAAHPWLRLNKARYVLSVLEGRKVLKTYPIALGREPRKRKLCFDNASTPEGRYTLSNLQPQATFHRAYDVDYPNATDQARYQVAAPGPEIGGEIQIHGCGIASNWTFGCMALRNEDMDELFRHPEIGVGTRLWIFGGELTLADLESDAAAGPQDRLALGRRQQVLGLPVTCLMDVATRRALMGKRK